MGHPHLKSLLSSSLVSTLKWLLVKFGLISIRLLLSDVVLRDCLQRLAKREVQQPWGDRPPGSRGEEANFI